MDFGYKERRKDKINIAGRCQRPFLFIYSFIFLSIYLFIFYLLIFSRSINLLCFVCFGCMPCVYGYAEGISKLLSLQSLRKYLRGFHLLGSLPFHISFLFSFMDCFIFAILYL